MKMIILASAAVCMLASLPVASYATPQDDLQSFRDFFYKRFPDTAKDDYINGVYSIDAGSREQWEAIEEFPPYELNIEKGEELFNTPFANGKSYADCFENEGIGVKQNYPHFDAESGKVVTMEAAINTCREDNGEKKLKTKKGKLADISAYMAYTSRGNIIDMEIPNDPRAIAIYEQGKQFFYSKRGQLNMSCADCHVHYSGYLTRSELLSPALGHVSHWPVYRSKWGGLGTLHRRYTGCNRNIRATPFKAQGAEYTALEYFHSYMSNGLKLNGPGSRK